MTMRLDHPGSGSLGGWLASASLCLVLGACSGSDDEPANASSPLTPADEAPSESSAGPAGGNAQPGTPEATDEGSPNVADRDEASADGESDTDSSEEASQEPVVETQSLDVPATDYCASVADWDPEWVQFEEEVLLLVNEFRSQPADCGVEGQFAAAPPLARAPVRRCAARLHSLDMFERDYFEHTDPDGVAPMDRMLAAGFEGTRFGENIAQGQQTPDEVMAAWMDSDGHCSNIMLAGYTVIGIGFDPGAQMRGLGSNYWTQNFGTPLSARRAR